MYRGVEVFREIVGGISKFLGENGYRSVGELVGIAHKPKIEA